MGRRLKNTRHTEESAARSFVNLDTWYCHGPLVLPEPMGGNHFPTISAIFLDSVNFPDAIVISDQSQPQKSRY